MTVTTDACDDERDRHASSDVELVRACLDANQDAWRTLVARYQRLVFSIARRQGLTVDQSEDVMQEVFIALMRQMASLHNPGGLPKWLITTTYRVAINVRRRNAMEQSSEVAGDAEAPEEDRDQWLRHHMVSEALSELGGRCEELLVALYRQGDRPSYDLIAEQVGMPVGSVGPTRARCMEKLLLILQRADASPGHS